jgi:hypothetical protein
MTAIARKTLRTSTPISEYRTDSPARRMFDSLVSVVILLAMGAAACGLVYLASRLW